MSLLSKMTDSLRVAGYKCRQDITIVDFNAIGSGSRVGEVLLSYDRHLAAPDASQVEAFFVQNYNNSVQANLGTLQVHADDHCVSVVANTQWHTRSLADANDKDKMAYITATSYFDLQTETTWDVVQNESGQKSLLRRSAENLQQLIEARKTRTSRSLARLSNLRSAAVQCDVGDRIQFWDAGIVAYGKVSSQTASKVTVQGPTGSVKIDPAAVLKVTHKAPAAISNDKDVLREFFEKAYGNPDFADSLTQTTSTELGDGATGK